MSVPNDGKVCRRRAVVGIWLVLFAALIVTPAGAAPPARTLEATRQWVLEHLRASLSSPLQLDEVASMLFGLVTVGAAAEHPDTARVLSELAGRVRTLDPAILGCEEVVNLYVTAGFLHRAGMAVDPAALTAGLQNCLEQVNPFDKASALFALCAFDASVTPERLARAMDSIEALQLPDGSFGSGYGMAHFYTTTHAVFALHACHGDPLVIQLGQEFLSSNLPRLRQAGFIDALLQSLLMLEKMGVTIPDQGRYVAYLRSRIRADGSICCFDRPGCVPDRHATSLLLEFLRVFPAARGSTATRD
jgi:hypothetical protein